MNKRLWVLNPILLALTLPAAAAQTEKKTSLSAPTAARKP